MSETEELGSDYFPLPAKKSHTVGVLTHDPVLPPKSESATLYSRNCFLFAEKAALGCHMNVQRVAGNNYKFTHEIKARTLCQVIINGSFIEPFSINMHADFEHVTSGLCFLLTCYP